MKKFLLTLLFAFTFISVNVTNAATRYIKPTATGTGDGSSWVNASGNLQAMINASATGDEVWVAAGTYKPGAYPTPCTDCTNPRSYSFQLKNGVKLYGGFSGTEFVLSQRNITANPTILSGDFNDNDVVTGSGSTLSITGFEENAFHVVISVSDNNSTVFDGFTVKSGGSNGAGSITVESTLLYHLYGGGMSIVSSSVNIANCTFIANRTSNGGGIYNNDSSPNITNCVFLNNYAQFEGGGIYNENSSSPNINNCTFSGNYIFSNSGGGIYNKYSSPNISNCTFNNNWAGSSGGAVYNQNSSPIIINCTFISNSTNNNGGAILNNTFSNPVITNSAFINNSSNAGGGMSNSSSNPTITNCTFYGNSASSTGGFMFNYQSNPTIKNCIVWGNSNAIANLSSTPAVSYTLIQGGFIGTGNLNVNPLFVNAADPAGVDGIHRTGDDGLRVQTSSPAINTGSNAAIPSGITTDIVGVNRILNGTVDMGAYEVLVCSISTTLYVDQSISASGNGDTWATAFKTFDEALFVAHKCPIVTTINVAAGTYKPTKKPYNAGEEMITSNARDVTFHLPDAVAIYGGFPNGGGLRNITANVTKLDGDINGNDVITGSGSSLNITNNTENAFHVVISVNDAVSTILDGFTIQGGNANGSSITVEGNSIFGAQGGGLVLDNSSVVVSNCIITGNSSINAGGGSVVTNGSTANITNCTFEKNYSNNNGGGIRITSSSPILSSCTFLGNRVLSSGGGIDIGSGNPSISDCIFTSNHALTYGGGVYSSNANAGSNIHNCTFTTNSANNSGGGIYVGSNSNSQITNCTFIQNTGSVGGGGLNFNTSSPTVANSTFIGNSGISGGGINTVGGSPVVANCTFTSNSAQQGGGFNSSDSTPNATISNCIAWGNTASGLGPNIYGNVNASYSIVQGGFAGIGNLNVNPLFIDAANPAGTDGIHRTGDDGLRLQTSSPAINTGSNAAIPSGITTDITGVNRIQNTTVDMGAYETPGTDCPILNTAPDNVNITNSNCSTGCTLTGGNISASTDTSCPLGSTLQYRVNSGSWTTTLPIYNQTGPAQTIRTRCVCEEDNNITSPESAGVTTLPGVCASPTASITNITGTTVLNCTTTTIEATATGGNSYEWSGGVNITTAANSFNSAGTYSVTVTNSNDCTATASITITTSESTSNTTIISACDSYTWSVNGQTYTLSGNYTHTVDCHTETLNLTITPSTGNTTTISACDSYTWNVNGQTYTLSGNYTHTVGCHTETLNLTITPSTGNTTTISTCDSYLWDVIGTTYTASGTYTSVSGCHTEILNLTIVESTDNTTNISACDSYLWDVNGTIYTASGTYTSVSGCHTEILNLTIVESTDNTTTISACDSYFWDVNGTTYTTSGTYTSVSGCHTEILNLTITPTTGNTTNDTACYSYIWVVNGQNYTTSGTYTSGSGCHTDTLKLTITVDCFDCEGTPNGTALPGTSCDDGDSLTENDEYGTDCICAGTPVPLDCEGTPNGTALPGTSCDDGDSLTENDEYGTDCICAGTPIPLDCEGTPNGTALPGTTCDDGDSLTENDEYGTDCICAGTPIPLDCEGTPNGTALPGTSCDDGDSLTENDEYGTDCICAGTPVPLDCEGTPNGTALPGTSCDDGDSFTENDEYGTDCICTGTPVPLDCEGTPNGTALPGSSCDDGDSLTENDEYSTDCICAGTPIPLDCEGTPNGTALPGTSCDDGDSLTENDEYGTDCICAGSPIPLDCLGVPHGTTLPGSPCDDGNENTENDEYGSNCVCAGTPISTLCNIGATLNGTTNLCAGSTIGLIATGGNQYQWSGPNGFTQFNGGSITRTNASPTMSGTYSVTITNNICVDVLSIEVTVHSIPSATLIGATSICSGGTIVLTATAGAVAYQWSGPGGFTQNTGNINTLTRSGASTLMAGLYKVTVTNVGGCTASGSRNVSVSAPTTANVSGATSVCAGNTLALTSTTAGANYQWSGPGGFTFNGASMTRTQAIAGTYTVTVTNAAGCISTASRYVTINAVPNLTITNGSNCTRIYLIISGGNSYAWSGPGGFTANGSMVHRNPATATMFGTYTVTATGSGGCTTTASITVNPCSNKTFTTETTISFTAYPNPVHSTATISFTLPHAEEVILSVYDVVGKEIAFLYKGIVEAGLTNVFPFETDDLPSGTYFAILHRADGNREVLPVLVVK